MLDLPWSFGFEALGVVLCQRRILPGGCLFLIPPIRIRFGFYLYILPASLDMGFPLVWVFVSILLSTAERYIYKVSVVTLVLGLV
jgi:hypothetical protein